MTSSSEVMEESTTRGYNNQVHDILVIPAPFFLIVTFLHHFCLHQYLQAVAYY